MRPPTSNSSAFSLVEVAFSLGIVAFALVAIFGLLPTGIASNQASLAQSAAVGFAAAIASDLRSTPASATASTRYGITLSTTAVRTTELYFTDSQTIAPDASSARYKARITIIPPTTGTKGPTSANIVVQWPAQAAASDRTKAFEAITLFVRPQ